MGEALRRQGLDEHAVAGNWVHVVNRLTGNEPGDGGVEKLLVDVLKECSRQLEAEAEQASERSGGDAFAIVQLVHKVDRPVRPAPQLAESGK
jgi:hypothetical protein